MKKRQKKPKQWFGCYQDSWKGVITAASYAHPAKFAKGLVERILDYMADKKWIQRGDVIGDPFGGVGTGGIVAAYRGYQWIGVELEPKFFELARGNWEKHRSRWAQIKGAGFTMLRGDSRQFDVMVNAILSSPPYVSGGHHTDAMEGGNRNGRGQTRKVKAIVGSPPYVGSLDDGGPEKQHPDGYPRSNDWSGYGKSEGQIATLKSGDVEQILGIEQPFQKQIIDGVVGSPPFLGCRSDTTSSGGGINKRGYEGKHKDRPSHRKVGERSYQAGQDKPRDPANIEVLEPGEIAAVIASPPYETISAGSGGLNHLPAREGQQGGREKGPSQSADQTYGTTEGQIAHTRKASIDAFLTSPAYADSINSDSHGIDFGLAKPDYPGRRNTPARNKAHSDAAANMRYGTPGQIGALKAVVSSPPWEKNVEGGRAAGKFKGDKVLKSKRGKGATDKAVRAQAAREIGQEKGETYWQAVAQVYHACFLSLKPGGHMALVVKDFIKDKKRIPLCSDTMRLLVWLGFEEEERIHAMLTEESIVDDLFEGTRTSKKERKSFFRRLHESKLAPDDPRRINFEEILIVRKPCGH